MDLPYTLTVQEAAKLLRISQSQAYELVHRGVIPSVRLSKFQIRIHRDTLLKWLEGNHVSA